MQKILLMCMALLCGCASNSERENAGRVAEAAGLTRVEIQTEGFALTTYQRMTVPDAAVHVYIEGDGFAWVTRSQPSADPTPRRAVGLSLAIADSSPNVVYLARPCQYSIARSPRCAATYWTDKRFAEEVVQAMNHALDVVMHSMSDQKIELVGYSGGGAVAALLAARRSDVASLRTVAGNLDHVAVNRQHNVSAMPDSLNPIDVADRLTDLPQIHFVGRKDQVIPPSIARNFVQRIGRCAQVVELPGATHSDGWDGAWPKLLELMPTCHKVE